METARQLISAMREAAAPGQEYLGEETLRELGELTQGLLAARPAAVEEYRRFLSIGERAIPLDVTAACEWARDATIVVTGGTGCIGSTLMGQLASCAPGRLISVSRGVTDQWPLIPGAEYRHCDIRDPGALAALFGETGPDLVFHAAAQRSPALAETEVHRTVTTNVFGTRNVIAAAAQAGARQVVCASTGKALRPYTPDVYAASKRAAEWILSTAATASGSGAGATRYSAARFTHVVDNSIIHQRLLKWSEGGVIRLHGADIVFYAQSALESAQLLLWAGLGAAPGSMRVYAITDLGWPVSLLDMTLGMLRHTGSRSPIYLSGHDRGYEGASFPGLYDPRTAGERSPLLSIFEASRAGQSPCGSVDFVPLEFAADSEADALLLALEDTCTLTDDPSPVRKALDTLSWSLLDAALGAVPPGDLARALTVTEPHRPVLNDEHRRMLAAVERHAGRAARQADVVPSVLSRSADGLDCRV